MDCSKYDRVKQLYDSKMLVDYPTQSNYQIVSGNDLLLIQELDAEDASDLQVEHSVNHIQSLKPSPGHAHREKEAIRKNSSFEDLTDETKVLRKKEPDESDVKNVKIYTQVDLRNLIQNHFDASKPSEAPSALPESSDGSIDWIEMYNLQKFSFRDNPAMLARVKRDVSEFRAISPQSQYYDTLFLAKGNQEKANLMESCVNLGANLEEREKQKLARIQRQQAWCVMLGIDYHGPDYQNFKALYEECIKNNLTQEDMAIENLKQIYLDVRRTFPMFNLKFLSADIHSGRNKLYNLLKVFALMLEPEIGYVQGMNFIAAVILMQIPDEVLACRIFYEVLTKNQMVRLYISSTPKLFDIGQELARLMRQELPAVHEKLFEAQIILEIVLAGSLMTLFCSTLPLSESTHVLNMFILEGESFLHRIILNAFRHSEEKILAFEDQFELQSFIQRQMLEEALRDKALY